MANPLGKKNPFLSMWLSGANAWAGAARGLMSAEWRRQQTAMLKEMTRPPRRTAAKRRKKT